MLILKASKIHGVGVFTTEPIKVGQKIDLFKEEDWAFRRRPAGYARRYSVKDEDGYHGPADFHRMSIGWYLNHSQRPNVIMRGTTGTASRYIRAGAELTVNYDKL